MKHLLLLFAAALCVTSAAAQNREYDYGAARKTALNGMELIVEQTVEGTVEGTAVRLYYDPETREYISYDAIREKYGDGVIAGIKYVIRNADSNYDFAAAQRYAESGRVLYYYNDDYDKVYYDPDVNNYIPRKEFVEKYGNKTATMLYSMQNDRDKMIRRASQSTLKMRSANLAAGCSLIGGALSVSLISSLILQNQQEQNSNNLAMLNRTAKTQKVINGVCAGVGIVGVITVLTGLYREDASGITIAPNVTLQDYNAGMALQVRF